MLKRLQTTNASPALASDKFAEFTKAAAKYAMAASDPARVRVENLFPVGSEIFLAHLAMTDSFKAWQKSLEK